ncbi:MAG: succinate dehydrogenase/fumarate reductase iron-sulfur subunit [bacterium]
MAETISLTLKIWRQKNSNSRGYFETFEMKDVDVNASFLEMLDILNETLILESKDPITFEHDCREGICGSCGAMINGEAHGPIKKNTLCQLHLRDFKDGETLVIEPFRAKAMPVLKDLMIDRSSFDRIMAKGGYVSVKTGSAPDANSIPVQKEFATKAFDAAACIGCSACVAACPNAAAMLFVSAKVSHLALLPQGQIQRKERVKNMVDQMDAEGFGNCSNQYLCEAACPKGISVENIARMNKDYLSSKLGE